MSCSDPADDDSGSHSLRENKLQGTPYHMSIINESELSCSVQMRLSWDSELANSFLSYPSLYRVFIEYKKEEKDRQVEILKYPYELLVTIVEAIKTVRLIGKLDSLHSPKIFSGMEPPKTYFYRTTATHRCLNSCTSSNPCRTVRCRKKGSVAPVTGRRSFSSFAPSARATLTSRSLTPTGTKRTNGCPTTRWR